MKTTSLLFLSVILLCVASCEAQKRPQQSTTEQQHDTPRYSTTQASRDGIGKWYMGREISHVMGHLGASWLERPERETEEQPQLIIENLGLKTDHVIADIGAGTGYFSFRMSNYVPEGEVIAVDIQPEMLAKIEQKKQVTGVENIRTVLGTEKSPALDSAHVDVVLIVDVYHEMAYPYEMMQGIVRAMKSGGRLFLVEYRGEDPTVPIKPLHKMTEAQARAEMKAAGLSFVSNLDFLPRQHVLVFEKK